MSTSKPSDAYSKTQSSKSFRSFAADLETAMNSVLPSPDRVYDRVSVLVFRWENDDTGVENLETELLACFKNDYNYEIESYVIPIVYPVQALGNKLGNWSINHGGEHNLRIYIYSGHASNAGTTAFYWNLAGRADQNGRLVGPHLNWLAMRPLIETIEGDIAYIFDCCSAGSVAMYDGPETLAAVRWTEAACSMLNFSFTRALIDTFKDLNKAPETLAGIYARLFRNASQNQVGACPVHIPKKGAPSITIAPRDRSQRSLVATPREQDHRVLLSIKTRFDATAPDLQQWKNWLMKTIPPGVLSVDIKVESVYNGSGVILVTVPLEIWTMLDADDPAFKFVAHVESNNILPQLESSMPSALPYRPLPPSGKENKSFGHQRRKSIG